MDWTGTTRTCAAIDRHTVEVLSDLSHVEQTAKAWDRPGRRDRPSPGTWWMSRSSASSSMLTLLGGGLH